MKKVIPYKWKILSQKQIFKLNLCFQYCLLLSLYIYTAYNFKMNYTWNKFSFAYIILGIPGCSETIYVMKYYEGDSVD